MDSPTPFFSDRVIPSSLRRLAPSPIALRAIGKATELFGLLHGQNLGKLRSSKDPLQKAYGTAQEHETVAWIHHETAQILGSRLDRIPERQRPHYTAEERARILRVKHLLALSAAETARLFRLASGTLARWERAIRAESRPPNVWSAISLRSGGTRTWSTSWFRTMALSGFGGNGQIARTLARAGWKISETTVGRYRREKATNPPSGPQRVQSPGRQLPADLLTRWKYSV